MKTSWKLLVPAALALFSLVGCSSEAGTLTQLVVTIDSNLDVPGEIDRLEVRVGGKAMADPATADLTKIGTPRTLSLVHDSGPLGPVTIAALGLLGSTLVVEQDAEVYFEQGKTVEVHLTLSRACKGVICQAGSTCADGDCVPTDSFRPGSQGGFATGGDADAQVAANGDGGASSGGSNGGATAGDAAVSAGGPPTCSITFPVVGDLYQVNHPASLLGACNDDESGPITSNAYWKSDRQGGNLALGVESSGTFTKTGMHTLQLCARDPLDASMTACSSSVVVTVTSTAQPTVMIQSITQTGGADPFVAESAIAMTGTGTGAGTSLSWSDSMSGPMSGETSTSLTVPLAGKHQITLTATDRDGNAVSVSQSFVVLAPGRSTLTDPFTGPNPTIAYVDTIVVDPAGSGYAASDDGKLYQFDPADLAGSATAVLDVAQLPGKVQDAALDMGLSQIYLATAAGLVRCAYSSASGINAAACTTYTTSTNNSDLASNDVLSVEWMQGSNNQRYLLVGTSEGLLRATPSSPSTGSNRLDGITISDIAVDSVNHVAWLATSEGLYRYDPVLGSDNNPQKVTNSGQPSATMRSVAVGSDGAIWVGSVNGLGRFQPAASKWTVWNTTDGLISNDVRTVALSHPMIDGVARDVVWIGTNAGVSRFDPSIKPASFTSLTTTDGLPSNQINDIVVLADGSKLFATSSGIALYVGL